MLRDKLFTLLLSLALFARGAARCDMHVLCF